MLTTYTYIHFILQIEKPRKTITQKMTKFHLLDFPDEVLLKIFQHFDQTDLLNANNVCTRFEAIAQDAFPYVFDGTADNKFLSINANEKQEFYDQIFGIFGEKVVALSALRIKFIDSDITTNGHAVYKWITSSWPSITHLIIQGNDSSTCTINMMDIALMVSKLICLKLESIRCLNAFAWSQELHPYLTTFGIKNTEDFDRKHVVQLVKRNSQLRQLHVVNCCMKPGLLFGFRGDTLSKIDLLELGQLGQRGETCKYLKIEFTVVGSGSLTVSVSGIWNTAVTNALRTMAKRCRRVKRLHIPFRRYADDKHFSSAERKLFMDSISLFEQVNLLTIEGIELESAPINVLVQNLPELRTLRLKYNSFNISTPEDVLFVFSEFPNLKDLALNFSHSHRNMAPFGMHFYYKFLDIIQKTNRVCTFALHSINNDMLFTNEKCILNGELRHWIGYETKRSRSQTNFSSLNEACIGKIAKYLNQNESRALYRTCRLATQALASQIKRQTFEVFIEEGFLDAKDTINLFGEHIRKLVVYAEMSDPRNAGSRYEMDIWNQIDKGCGKRLIELTMRDGQIESLNSAFSKLETLKLISMRSNGSNTFSFHCPKLKRLEINSCEFRDNIQAQLQPGTSFGNLEQIKINGFNSNTLKMFNGLSKDLSLVKELSLEYHECDDRNPFWYIDDDTIHLVESCPMLEVLHLKVEVNGLNQLRMEEEHGKHLQMVRTRINKIFQSVQMKVIQNEHKMWTFQIILENK